MPDSSGATVLENLPQEIIDKILIRLPSKDVGRCRAVSASWHSATSTPRFMLEHHRRQPSLPIVNATGYPPNMVVLRDAGASVSNQHIWPLLPGVKQLAELSVCAICDGFVIINKRYYQFYICNPVIRKQALLPLPKDIYHYVIGFYRHHQTGEYRVLLIPQTWSYQPIDCLHVLTVGSDEPRQVRVRSSVVSSPFLEQKFLKELCDSHCYPPPVHSCGSLHWFLHSATKDIAEGGGDIVVFDTEDESFRWMRSPTQSFHKRRLFNMDGALALWGSSTPTCTTMDVWVMWDYDAEIWAFKYRIDLQTVEASRQLYLTSFEKLGMISNKTTLDSPIEEFIVMEVLNERELLINYNEKRHVLRCDIDGKFIGIVNLGNSLYDGLPLYVNHHRYQESIVPIPYQAMQEDEESPFSIRHV